MPASTSQALRQFFWFGTLLISIWALTPVFRNLKDTLVVSWSGADVIPILKMYTLWFKVPLCILFILLYKPQRLVPLFGVCLGLFTLIMLGFSLFLPSLVQWDPQAAALPVDLTQKQWIASSFYLFAELWSPVLWTLLFWTLANQTVATSHAKWMYPGWAVLIAITNFATTPLPLLLGTKTLPLVLIGGLCLLLALVSLNRIASIAKVAPAPQTPPGQFSQGFQMKYLATLLGVILSFGACTHFLDIGFKLQIRSAYPEPADYMAFMGQFIASQSLLTLMIVVLSCWCVWGLGWFRSAILVPSIALVAGGLFYGVGFVAHSPGLAVWYGSMTKILMTGISGTLFLATKEMAYIPLPAATKARGKAVVDFLIGRTSAMMVSAAMLWIIVLTGESPTSPLLLGYQAFGYFLFVFIWFFCLFKLKRYYHQALMGAKDT